MKEYLVDALMRILGEQLNATESEDYRLHVAFHMHDRGLSTWSISRTHLPTGVTIGLSQGHEALTDAIRFLLKPEKREE